MCTYMQELSMLYIEIMRLYKSRSFARPSLARPGNCSLADSLFGVCFDVLQLPGTKKQHNVTN